LTWNLGRAIGLLVTDTICKKTINFLVDHLNPSAMTAPSKTIYYFGFYLLLTGLILIAAPNFLLSLFRIETTSESWIRVLGAVIVDIGFLYIYMAAANHTLFLTLTVFARYSILVWFSAFTLLGWAPPQLVLFGLIDAAGATWTYLALRSQKA